MSIVKRDISWLKERVVGFDALLYGTLFQTVFDSGGYIAGGLVRELLRTKTTAKLPAYFNRRGDVDVFFPTNDAFTACLLALGNGTRRHWQDSFGKNAMQTCIPIRMPSSQFPIAEGAEEDWEDGFSVQFQLVHCRFLPPDEQINSFDFVNCQAAFNREHVWVDDRIEQLEALKTLQIENISSVLPWRVHKYFSRHGYRKLEPLSRKYIIGWIKDYYLEHGEKDQKLSDAMQKMIAIGDDIIPDETVVEFIGKFHSSARVVDYSNLNENRVRISSTVDVAQQEINRRRMLKAGLLPGDYVEIDPIDRSPEKWQSVMLLGQDNRIREFTDVSRNENWWHVMLPSNQLASMHISSFRRVLSRYNETEQL